MIEFLLMIISYHIIQSFDEEQSLDSDDEQMEEHHIIIGFLIMM